MPKIISEKEYIAKYQVIFNKSEHVSPILTNYLNAQFQNLNKLIEEISKETFWQVFPEVLGIDAKLNLLAELISFEDFSNEEIIRITENDYTDYFKELCGYDLKTKDKPSMIFQII